MTSKALLAGLGAALAICTIGATDASACSRRWARGCDSYYPPPVGYGYGYGPGYGYAPPAPVYGWGPPPTAYYASPYAAPVQGYGYGAEYYGRGDYGYRGRRCDPGYGYGPPPPYNGGRGYRPTGYWAPVR
jgi:hypothetical protein